MVERPLMVLWVVESIPDSGPVELIFVQVSVPRLVKQRPWYVLSCLWDSAELVVNRKK